MLNVSVDNDPAITFTLSCTLLDLRDLLLSLGAQVDSGTPAGELYRALETALRLRGINLYRK